MLHSSWPVWAEIVRGSTGLGDQASLGFGLQGFSYGQIRRKQYRPTQLVEDRDYRNRLLDLDDGALKIFRARDAEAEAKR